MYIDVRYGTYRYNDIVMTLYRLVPGACPQVEYGQYGTKLSNHTCTCKLNIKLFTCLLVISLKVKTRSKLI